MDHPGIVTAVKPGFVTVQIESTSACAACAAHSKCGFAESKTKSLDIPIPQDFKTSRLRDFETSSFAVGDRVTVTIDHTRGLLATWWAYVLPAILLIAVAVALSLAALPEPLVILLTFATLGLYLLVLYLFREKLDSRFTLELKSLNTHHSSL
jgi:sigma-E factor negative regulatory protein RseC